MSQQDVKPILASSIKVASMAACEFPNSKSPALYAPPDMNSELHLLRTDKNIKLCHTNPVNPGIVSGQYPLEEGPLSQMSEAVSNFYFARVVFWQI